jgi:hypothetical protein
MSLIQPNDLINNNNLEGINNQLSTVQSTKNSLTTGAYLYPKSNVLPFIHEFYVPKNLFLEELLAQNGLNEWLKSKWLQKVYFVPSFIQYAYLDYKRVGVKRNGYVGIHKTVLARNVGDHIKDGKAFYLLVLEVLRLLGVIEVNHKYWATTEKRGGFPKSFRLAKPYWNQEPKIIGFSQKLPPRVKDESRITNEVQEFIHSNIKNLTLDESALKSLVENCSDIGREIRIRRNAEQFRRGAINLREGRRQRRITHRLTSCPKEMRSVFRLNGGSLAEFDIPSTQPTLLLALCDNIPVEEKNDYHKTLRQGIYASLAPKADAEKAKRQFGRFAFGRYKRQNQFGRNFSKRFPTLTKRIREFPQSSANGKTLSCYLQDLEAEICIYSVIRQCMERNILVVPVHDAFLVEPKSFAVINSLVKAEFERRFDFALDLKQKNHNAPAKECSTLGKV